MEDKLAAWFESHRHALIEGFMRAARDAQRFPGFSGLRVRQLREFVRREVDGLISYMASDDDSLQEATKVHKDQNRRFLADISLAEQLEFLQARVEVVNQMFLSEPGTEPLHKEFDRKFEMARRYYRTQSRAIDLEERFARLGEEPQ
ncbi:MAG: hypothetical protein AAF657_17995 [Acidobacteriota bacterium]